MTGIVWCVFRDYGRQEGTVLLAVFSTKDLADTYVEAEMQRRGPHASQTDYNVEEWDVDDPRTTSDRTRTTKATGE